VAPDTGLGADQFDVRLVRVFGETIIDCVCVERPPVDDLRSGLLVDAMAFCATADSILPG
jgi:hypothetical protein